MPYHSAVFVLKLNKDLIIVLLVIIIRSPITIGLVIIHMNIIAIQRRYHHPVCTHRFPPPMAATAMGEKKQATDREQGQWWRRRQEAGRYGRSVFPSISQSRSEIEAAGCLELDMFLHSGLPGQVRTATTDTRRTLQASKRLDHARDNIARLDDEASRDYHAYREAETAWKRSVATLNEWQHHRLELELFLRDAFIAQSQEDLEVPSPSSPEVVWLERR